MVYNIAEKKYTSFYSVGSYAKKAYVMYTGQSFKNKNKNIYLSFSHQHLYITVFTSVKYSENECIYISVGGHTI
jgi:hypothetical protein